MTSWRCAQRAGVGDRVRRARPRVWPRNEGRVPDHRDPALALARHSQIQDWLNEWLPDARHKAKNGGQNRASAMVFCRLISSGCTWPGGTEKSRTAPSRPVITSQKAGSGTFQYFSSIVQRYKAKSPRASSALVRDDRRVKRLLKRQQMRWTQR